MNFPGWIPAVNIKCSVLKSPTPSAPVAAARSAASGMLTFAFTSVTVKIGASAATACATGASSLASLIPSNTKPFLPSKVTPVFSFKVFVASPVPTTQGIPNSREMIDAWQVTPPSSVTIPLALLIAGTISGVVIVVTITSPSSILSSSSMSKTIFTLPVAIPGLAPKPLTRTSPSTLASPSSAGASSPRVVIGLAWSRNRCSLSNAHSVSIGSP